MAWPTPLTYQRAIDSFYENCVLDPHLVEGQPQRGRNGTTLLYAGNFSVTFPIEVSDFFFPKTFALRCWTGGNKDTYENRYKKIENFLNQINLPYFVEFKYVQDGIFVDNETWPITRMEWAEGQTLRNFIEQNVDRDSNTLKAAASEFQNMVAMLHEHRISHGDLQHGNILINQNGDELQIKLIDYDSLWIEALGTVPQTTLGLPDYQHPYRIEGNEVLNEKIDYFSELVIYLSLLSLSEKPELWHQFEGQVNGLLFSRADFENPENSDTFQALEGLSPDVQQLTYTLKSFCWETDINQLIPLEDILPNTRRNPWSHYNFAKDCFQRDEYDQAIVSYQRAIYCDRNFEKAHYELGRVYLKQGKYGNATIPLHKTIALDPNFKEAHYDLGRAYFELNKLETALQIAKEALKFDPHFQLARQLLQKIRDVYHDRGLAHFNAQRYSEAISEFQNMIKIDPDFKESYHFLSSAYFKLGNLQTAEKVAKEGLQVDSNYDLIKILLQDIKGAQGAKYLSNEQYNEASEAFKEALSFGLYSKDVHYYLGSTYFKLGNLQAAEDATYEALSIDPTYQLAEDLLQDIKCAYYKQGTTCLKNEKYNEAVTAFEAAIVMDPGFKEAYRDLGHTYFELGNLQAAVKMAKKALNVDSADRVTRNLLKQIKLEYYKLGEFYRNNEQCREAVTAFKAAIALDKNFKEAYRGLGLAHYELGNLQAAQEAARDALNIDENYTLVFYLLGAIKQDYYTRGRNSLRDDRCTEAIHQFQKAISIDPNFIDARYNLGIAYFKLDNLEAAHKAANEVLSLDSNYQPVCELLEHLKNKYRKRGTDYWQMSEYAGAVVAYQQAIEIDPNFKEAHYNLGIAYQSQKQYAQAIEAYQDAIKIDPNFKEAYCNLGIAYQSQKQYAQAIEAYQDAIKIDLEFKDAYYSLGLTYFKVEKFQEARNILEEVLRLDPNYQFASKLLEKIDSKF